MTKSNGTLLDFAFRDMARGGKAVGYTNISLLFQRYWLAPEHQGLGLMAKALKMMLYHVSLIEVGKRKFNPHAFIGNCDSRKALENVRFSVQEDMDGTVVKDGKEIPRWVCRLYLTDEDVVRWDEEIHKATPIPLVVL
ncbi:hypothetical protein BGX24_009477 [Mortierella sp. AD032]|nr:hypothetical protein BGX24_009477 [Mortierella sp. AD032]